MKLAIEDNLSIMFLDR